MEDSVDLTNYATSLRRRIFEDRPGPCGSEERTHSLCAQAAILVIGVFGNAFVIFAFARRKKLATASFAYLHIQAIFQLLFFLIPYSLWLCAKHYLKEDPWLLNNFLPAVLGVFYFTVAVVYSCYACRLQLIVLRLHCGRTWNSYLWIAWRKLCWILPLAVIVYISIYFEHQVGANRCGNFECTGKSEGQQLSEFGRTEALKIRFIRRLPTILHWFAALLCITFCLWQKVLRFRRESLLVAKHGALCENLRHIVTAIVLSQSITHLPQTLGKYGAKSTQDGKVILSAIAFAATPFFVFVWSSAFRDHCYTVIQRYLSPSRCTTENAKLFSLLNDSQKDFSDSYPHSRLEVQNSEIDDRRFNSRRDLMVSKQSGMELHVSFAVPLLTIAIIEEGDRPE